MLHCSIFSDFAQGFCYTVLNEVEQIFWSIFEKEGNEKLRLLRRPARPKRLLGITSLALLITLTSCSLPEVTVDKKQSHPSESRTAFSSKPDSVEMAKSDHAQYVDKSYLATVHVRFSQSGDVSPMNFEISKDKHKLITFNLWESEEKESVSTINLGYTHTDGGIIGLHLAWRF